MRKTKILTVLGVLLAMGITACNGGGKTSEAPKSEPKSEPAPSSQPAPATKDATGHIWGADTDVAASGEGVAYKKATCTENDGFIKLAINQSSVTYASGSSRKSGTPEGYTKLDGNNQSMSAKFNYDHYAEGKLYLFGCMDGWSSNASKKAFSYNGSPNIEVKVNGEALDIAALADVVYTDFLSGDASDYSDDGYALIGNIKLDSGVNEVSYKRLASMNTLVKDFVFVIENKTKPAHVHTADTEWHKDATNHWHECTAGDGYKMDSAAHTFGAWEEHASAQPCKVKGTKTRACSVCGYTQEEELDLAEHTWVADESKTDVPATCIAGTHYEKCSVCGETRETAIPKDPDAEHTWGEWEIVTEATCAQGQRKRVCSKCGIEDFEVIAPADGVEHQWGEETVVPGEPKLDEEGQPVYVDVPAPTSADANATRKVQVFNYVGYTKKVCSKCGTWKVTIDASTATLAEGSTWKGHKDLEDNNIHGMKLNKNNNSFSYKFKFDTKADVLVYQVGCMDGGTGNLARNYFSRQDNKDEPNFEFSVNGKAIDLSERHDEKFSDYLKEREEGDPLKAKNYSTFGEVLIGESELVQGDNEFVYKRLESFNLIITDIVLVVTPLDHDHEAGSNWVDTDPVYHWKNCTHSDGHKMEKGKHDYTGVDWEIVEDSTCTKKGTKRRACIVCGHWDVQEIPLKEHTWVADESKTDVPATCAAGIHYEKCSVCGETREVATTPTEEHGWVDGTAVKNSDSKDVIPMTCSKGCGKVGAKMSVNDYSSAQFDGSSDQTADAIRPSQGKAIVYKLSVAHAGNYSLSFGMKCNKNGSVKMSSRGFSVKVNGVAVTVTQWEDSVTPDSLGLNATTAIQVELAPSIPLTAEENTIEITCSGYRLQYGGLLAVYEI